MDELVHYYRVDIGDRSHDGHGMSEIVHIKTNYSRELINDAHSQVSKGLGIDFLNDVCVEYEDTTVSPKHAAILIGSGVPLAELCEEVYDNGTSLEYYPWVEGILQIYLEMAKLNLPSLKYKIVTDEVPFLIDHSIGYGLFSN